MLCPWWRSPASTPSPPRAVSQAARCLIAGLAGSRNDAPLRAAMKPREIPSSDARPCATWWRAKLFLSSCSTAMHLHTGHRYVRAAYHARSFWIVTPKPSKLTVTRQDLGRRTVTALRARRFRALLEVEVRGLLRQPHPRCVVADVAGQRELQGAAAELLRAEVLARLLLRGLDGRYVRRLRAAQCYQAMLRRAPFPRHVVH